MFAASFQDYADELTEHQDRRERIVKLSRDVTQAAKRIIFHLHRVTEQNKSKMLEEAQAKEVQVFKLLANISSELNNETRYIYQPQYSPGLQEFIEALSLRYFLESQRLLSLEDLRSLCVEHGATNLSVSEEDFLLGLSDLSGELMRWGINSVGASGLGVEDSVSSVALAQVWVRSMQMEMRPLGVNVRGLHSKLNVMDNSLIKLEKAAYTLALRSEEYKDFPDALKEYVRRSQYTVNYAKEGEEA